MKPWEQYSLDPLPVEREECVSWFLVGAAVSQSQLPCFCRDFVRYNLFGIYCGRAYHTYLR